MTDQRVSGKGYSYLASIIGLLMLVYSSLDFEFASTNGNSNFRVKQKEIPTAVLGFAGGLITVGLGIRFTVPELLGRVLPSSQWVEDLVPKSPPPQHPTPSSDQNRNPE